MTPELQLTAWRILLAVTGAAGLRCMSLLDSFFVINNNPVTESNIMPFFTKKPVTIEAITFDQLVAHGRKIVEHEINGMPWSFDYKGHPITHENDNCYLIPTLEGTMNFRRSDMLITGVFGEIYPCKIDIFEKTYVPVEESNAKEVKP